MLCGGVQPLSGDKLVEAEQVLSNSLAKLAAGDGPSYTVSKIVEATSQVVSGILYKYRVELRNSAGDVKQSKVEIWSQPWLENGIKVTIECEGEEAVVKSHSA